MMSAVTTTHAAAAPRAYSYVRFSSDKQASGSSLERQVAASRAWAERHGYELDEATSYHDLGVSAYRGDNSETGALAAFLKAIEDGRVRAGDILIVENLDRISRAGIRKAQRLIENILEAGVKIVTLSDGKVYDQHDLDDILPVLTMLLTFARAHDESKMKAMRVKAAWLLNGKATMAGQKRRTSLLPGWLAWEGQARKSNIVTRPDRVEIVRQVFAWFDKGELGYTGIAARLNETGVATLSGKGRGWQPTTVRHLLRSRAVIGELVIGEWTGTRSRPTDTVQDYFPAVIDREQFARVQARLEQTQARGIVNPGKRAGYLVGILRCPACGGIVKADNKGKTPGGKQRGAAYQCRASMAGACDNTLRVRVETVDGVIRRDWSKIVGAAEARVNGEVSEAFEEVENLKHVIGEVSAQIGLAGRQGNAGSLAGQVLELERQLDAARQRLTRARDRAVGLRVGRVDLDDTGAVNAELRAIVESGVLMPGRVELTLVNGMTVESVWDARAGWA